MPVIAVVNRKGGSGKSTLSAHLAAWCAHQGHAVMLGDVDRQQSTRSWLRKRHENLPAIAPWTVDQNILRVPAGITHVVLDTPGGLHGFDLARMVMFADIILMPVCGSAFDRESAASCHAELMALPRVASGRCKVACIGMRIDVRSRTPQVLKEWANALGMPFIGVLRETQAYVQCLERGMTLFDLPPERVTTDLRQWEPILGWLKPQLDSSATPAAAAPVTSRPTPAMPAAASQQHIPSRLAAPARSPAPARLSPAPAATALPVRPSVAPVPLMPPSQKPTAAPVSRLSSSPRVLDRVVPGNALHKPPVQMTPASTQASEAPPIPSFLKLVKC